MKSIWLLGFNVILVFSLVFLSCAIGSTSNSGGNTNLFDGTWNKNPQQITISGDNWTMRISGVDYYKGTFTVNESAKSFIAVTTQILSQYGWVDLNSVTQSEFIAVVQYNLNGNTMVLSGNTNEANMPMNGTWTKQ